MWICMAFRLVAADDREVAPQPQWLRTFTRSTTIRSSSRLRPRPSCAPDSVCPSAGRVELSGMLTRAERWSQRFGRPSMAGMPAAPLDDATTRHLEEIAIDVLGLLGPGIELTELAIDADQSDRVVIRARYRMADEVVESVGRGESALEAHVRLREAIVGDRIGLGLRVLV